jgi:hypothetical protein
MVVNRFDQASRYVAKLDPVGFLRWLLGNATLLFRRWLDTRSLPFPGEPDRTCDTVACVVEAGVPGILWALLVEFQVRPDGTMFGRILEYLGRLWREVRPRRGSGQRRRRYEVGAAVLNLTGTRRTASRRMRFGRTRVLTRLGVAERHLAREDAAATLTGIAAGTHPRCLFPFIPLMQGGGEPAIMAQWVQLAQAEPDHTLRGDYGGLALVFAELAGCLPAWRQALGGWNVTESQQVLEWMAQGEARGETKRQIRSLLRSLELRFPPGAPPDLAAHIQSTTDLVQLSQWFDAAVTASSLADFRQSCGL